VIRLLIALLCAIVGAAERWLLGETPGNVIVSAVILAIGYVGCSPRATSVLSHFRIAALLIGLAFVGDLFALAVTTAIDGKPSLSGSNWMINTIAAWALLQCPPVGSWAGVQPKGERVH
jgi:hypothetical protein